MKISFYKSVRKTKAYHIGAHRFFHAIINGVWSREVEAIRSEKDEAKQKAMKAQLPGVRLSGTFSSNNDDSLINHSGLICLDFDEKENPGITDWADFRSWIGNLEDVVFASLSVRGQGVFAVVKIHPVPQTKEDHLAFFNTISSYFASASIKVDESAKNVGRFRFVSFDADAVINIEAKVFRGRFPKKKNIIPADTSIVKVGRGNSPFLRMLEKIIERKIDITGGYKDWFALGCCIAANLGENGRTAFHQISQFSHLYDAQKTDKEYTKILIKGYTQTPAAYLFKVAKDYGILLKE